MIKEYNVGDVIRFNRDQIVNGCGTIRTVDHRYQDYVVELDEDTIDGLMERGVADPHTCHGFFSDSIGWYVCDEDIFDLVLNEVQNPVFNLSEFSKIITVG